MTNVSTTEQTPLAQSFQRIRALSNHINVHNATSTDAGWIPLTAFFAPDSEPLRRMIEMQETRYGTSVANVIGSTILQNYHWNFIASTMASYFAEKRLPTMTVENVQILISDEGYVDAIAFTDSHFTVLPDDKDSAHPDAIVVPCQDALRDTLRAGLESHLGWVIAQLEHIMGARPIGLWLAVADRCMSTASWLMQMVNPNATFADIQAETEPLLRDVGSPLRHKKVGLIEMTYEDQSGIFLQRGGCCYWYKTDGASYCSTCPHIPQAERTERWHNYLVQKHAKAHA